MTQLRQLAVLFPLVLTVLYDLRAICVAQGHAPFAEQIGETYGAEWFKEVEAIRYTFNIPEFKLSRSWVWQPGSDTVTYEGPGKAGKPATVTYRRNQLSSQSDAIKNDINPAFINDHNVLLVPSHVTRAEAAEAK